MQEFSYKLDAKYGFICLVGNKVKSNGSKPLIYIPSRIKVKNFRKRICVVSVKSEWILQTGQQIKQACQIVLDWSKME